MLLAAVLTLDPLDAAAGHVTARQVQRWFKQSLEAADAALFTALHEPNVPRAYTLSPVYPPTRDAPAWLRITSLDADLSALLADRLLPGAPRAGEIVLDPERRAARFAVRGVDLGPASRPPFAHNDADPDNPAAWAGRSDYGQLVTAVMQAPAPPLVFELYFHTCTSFRLNAPGDFKSNLPLPVPRYVFQSHLAQWDALAPAKLPVPVAPFFEYYVWVSYHRIRTVKEVFGGSERGKTVGFAGRVEFGMAARDRLPDEMQADWRHYIDVVRLLSAFAFYAGTGVRTTQGLGQTLPMG